MEFLLPEQEEQIALEEDLRIFHKNANYLFSFARVWKWKSKE